MSRLGQFRLAIEGRLQDQIDEAQAGIEAGLRDGVEAAGKHVQGRLRHQLATAGGGLARLQKTWRMNVYPRVPSDNPAAVVFSTVPDIIAAFDEGMEITPTPPLKRLLILLPEARRLLPSRDRGTGRFASRRSLEALQRALGAGEIAIRPVRRDLSLIVARQARLTRQGRLAARQASEGRRGEAVIGYLVPAARLPDRLNVQAAFDEGGAVLERETAQALVRRLGSEAA